MEIVPTPWYYYDRSIKHPKLRTLHMVYVQLTVVAPVWGGVRPRKVMGHFLRLSVTEQTVQLCGGSGAERRRGEGLGGSAKALLELPTTLAPPHQGVAARGGCHHVCRSGLAQLVCGEGHSVRPTAPGEPNGGSIALAGQRVKGSNSVDTGQTQDPRV